MGDVRVVYYWRYRCEIRKKMITTRYKTTREEIEVEHPDAVPIESSREERLMNVDPWSLCTSGFLVGVKDLGNGIVYDPDEKKPPTDGG